MNKENLIDAIDDSITNEIHLELAQENLATKSEVVASDDYHAMLKDLILMALPSPSQHVH